MKDTNDTNKVLNKGDPSRNPDLITGAPGSHPIGTGLGAVAGGAAAGAAVGTVAGPVGTIAGAAVGAVVGGLAGKGVAEAVNPTAEAAYWRKNHAGQPFAKGRSYEDYDLAYKTGYEGYAERGENDGTFEDRESELRKRYEATGSKMAWLDARPASYAAWKRLQE
jgi:phage tail tape-measure protein